MTYDFDETIPRRRTNSYKWDSCADDQVLPLWVADMDFRTCPAVTRALRERVDHGIFGYTRVPKEYYEAVGGWFKRRHGWDARPEWMLYTSGVVPALSATIKALCREGDKVLVQTPVYNCFFSSIRNNGCLVEVSPLLAEGDTYRMDFADLERRAADPRVRLMLLCNPHNPAGRVWTRDELARVGDICQRNGVVVVADEIHCELVYPPHRHTPFAAAGEQCLAGSVTLVSPSKAFNTAGLQIATIITPNDEWRERIDRAINVNEVCDVNPFGVIATIAAYTEGEEWLAQLIHYIYGNYERLVAFCRERLPQFPIKKLEGTYLAWMDCRALGLPSEQLERRLLSEAKLWLNAGTMYGPAGEGFMRWNLACPRATLDEAMRRFERFVMTFHGQTP